MAVALFLFWSGSAPAAHAETPPCGLTDTLLMGLSACRESVDLSAFRIPAFRMGQIYADLLHDSPELFHVAARLSYTYREETVDGVTVRLVEAVYPVYVLTGDELAAARRLYRDVPARAAEAVETCRALPLTEAERALFLHDLLADSYAYDTRPEAEANADAYGFFRDGVGICQAYALAYTALCRAVGLEADFVSSDTMDHAWNHVRVDGVWYHVDVTRDDPIPAAGGEAAVTHARFLRSDEGMARLGYRDYTCAAGHTCTDTRYETAEGDGVLESFSAPLAPVGNGWVGMDDAGCVVGVKFTENGVFVSQMGDANTDGAFDPTDLLQVYDPTLPKAWREWMREQLVE